MVDLTSEGTDPKQTLIDDLSEGALHGLQPARKKKAAVDRLAKSKDGLKTTLHVTDEKGRPIRFFMSAGQISDDTCAASLLGILPKAEWLLADKRHDADWLHQVAKDQGISACIPDRTSRTKTGRCDKRR